MRCCSRSTTCLASGLLVLAIGAGERGVAARGDSQPAVSLESAVRHAIANAVRDRMGREADVRIERLTIAVADGETGATLVAGPEPGARLGRPVRFTLMRVGRSAASRAGAVQRRATANPAGYAVASVFVGVDHLRAARPMDRGETCSEADVVESRGEVGGVLLQRLPRLPEIAGARTARDLMAGEVLTRSVLLIRPAVQSGDVVAVRVAGDGVTVQAQGIAEQSGGPGDVIRVVNRDSRRSLKVRVVGPGEVEVLQ